MTLRALLDAVGVRAGVVTATRLPRPTARRNCVDGVVSRDERVKAARSAPVGEALMRRGVQNNASNQAGEQSPAPPAPCCAALCSRVQPNWSTLYSRRNK